MRIQVGDVKLFFDVEGPLVVPTPDGPVERPTVVLLHAGPGADHSLFKDTIGPPLGRVAQVVYLDQRGDGRSDRSSGPHWNLETWSSDLGGFLDALELERPILLGSSIGGIVGLYFASQRPERVRKLVLVSAAARYVHARTVAAFDRIGGPDAGEVAATYFRNPNELTFGAFLRVCVPLYTRLGLEPEVIARVMMNPEASIYWDLHGAPRVDLREDAAKVQCPVLILAGEDDPSFTMSGAEELAASLPQERVEFRRYPAARHGVFRDAGYAVDDVVRFVLDESDLTA